MFVYKTIGGACVKSATPKSQGQGAAPAPAPSLGGAIAIQHPVGLRGRNLMADVTQIQSALARIAPAEGGAGPRFEVDGHCGPKTNNAIQQFQIKHFGWKGADGLVEPGRQTLQKLNALLARTAPASVVAPTTPTNTGSLTQPELRAAIELAQRWILSAQATVLAAVPLLHDTGRVDGLQAFGRDARMRLLNKHFQIDGHGIPTHRVQLILRVFDRMRQVFQRPGGMWGESAFEPDPLHTPGVAAYTWWGGFFLGGQSRKEAGHTIRLDTIYLCPDLKRLSEDIRAFVVVHELAHFVGHPEYIDDHAYNFQGKGAKIQRLTPQLRLLNAESYANFAFESARGGEPPAF